MGFSDFAKKVAQIQAEAKPQFLDLRQYELEGVKALNRYQYRILIKGRYRQFKYWLAMPFFAPIPWEVDRFYSQPGMAENNFNLDWYPIGTGPYLLDENNPNLRMVLVKNPKFHGETYPVSSASQNRHQGYFKLAGQPLPFIDRFVFTLETESIPRWNKFLQGYYDRSGISADSFDQAIRIDEQGQAHLTPSMKEKGIRLKTSVEPAVFYFGFNMLDDVVGGYSERARKLRQAIAIALDYREFISIFLNGRGQVAHGPIPPSIFGHQSPKTGYDPTIYKVDHGHLKRRSLQYARQLLKEAGYPNGIHAKTGQPLVLNYDAVSRGGPEEKAVFDWLREKFSALNITLHIRATQYNRFQQKMNHGHVQMFSWGWNADYPDPENFLFLFYGPNAKATHGGENAVNYRNPQFDRLFEQMRNLPDNTKRRRIIHRMVKILQKDQPWVWGYYPRQFILSHQWVAPIKPNPIANNVYKYYKLDPRLRWEKQRAWNQPITWPLWLIFGIVFVVVVPLLVRYWIRLHQQK